MEHLFLLRSLVILVTFHWLRTNLEVNSLVDLLLLFSLLLVKSK